MIKLIKPYISFDVLYKNIETNRTCNVLAKICLLKLREISLLNFMILLIT